MGTRAASAVAAFERPHGWGTSLRAATLAADSGAPQLWMADTGGVGVENFDWYRIAIEQFLDGVANTTLSTHRLVALPAIGIGEGGHGEEKWMVLPALVRYLAQEAARRDLDIALVARGEDVFAAAQSARRGLSCWDELPLHLRERAARSSSDGPRSQGGSLSSLAPASAPVPACPSGARCCKSSPPLRVSTLRSSLDSANSIHSTVRA
jgi:hypothetical protein